MIENIPGEIDIPMGKTVAVDQLDSWSVKVLQACRVFGVKARARSAQPIVSGAG